MGLRMQLVVYVVAAVCLALLADGFVRSAREASELHEVAVQHGLEVLTALAAPCSVPLATGEVEELDRIVASLTEENAWISLDIIDFTILDLEGRVVAATDPRRFGRLADDPFARRARRSDHPVVETVGPPGKRRLRLALPIVSGLRWGTASATLSLQRVDDLVASTRRDAMLGAATNALLVGLGLYLLLSLLVLRPMAEVIDTVRRLARGDHSARVEPGRWNPELQLLARVLNDLAERVGESTRELEQQVEQRTRALQGANERLEQLASTDGLTGLRNHRALQEAVATEVARCRRGGEPLALLMIDVDSFKAYNDTHGHPAGDEVLIGIADVLRRRLRSTDVAARYGGEEFAVVLPETSLENATAVAEELVQAVRAARFPRGDEGPLGRVTISAGAAAWTEGEAARSLIARADAALYRAKAAGRDCAVASEGPS